MANYKFGSGDLYDYYNGVVTRSPAFTGFPIADFNDHDSGIYVSPALPVAIENLARWVWQVKSWNVSFSETSEEVEFLSGALNLLVNPNELGILQIVPWARTSDTYFGWGVVINQVGEYGFQSDLFVNNDDIVHPLTDSVFNLDNIEAANTLVFASADPPFNTATATELTYWDWI